MRDEEIKVAYALGHSEKYKVDYSAYKKDYYTLIQTLQDIIDNPKRASEIAAKAIEDLT